MFKNRGRNEVLEPCLVAFPLTCWGDESLLQATIREMKVTWGWGVEKIGTVSSLGEQGTVIQLDSRALDSKEKAATCKGSSRRGVRELGSTIWWPGRRKGGWWAEGVGCARRPLNPSADLGDSVTRTDAHHTATSSPAHPRRW